MVSDEYIESAVGWCRLHHVRLLAEFKGRRMTPHDRPMIIDFCCQVTSVECVAASMKLPHLELEMAEMQDYWKLKYMMCSDFEDPWPTYWKFTLLLGVETEWLRSLGVDALSEEPRKEKQIAEIIRVTDDPTLVVGLSKLLDVEGPWVRYLHYTINSRIKVLINTAYDVRMHSLNLKSTEWEFKSRHISQVSGTSLSFKVNQSILSSKHIANLVLLAASESEGETDVISSFRDLLAREDTRHVA